MALTFKGGIHVSEHKHTRKCAVEQMPAPKTVSIPMSQHIGAHADPCVKAGDIVDLGQVIGVVEGKLGCNVHSSVSGKVVKIDEKKANNGILIRNVIIENDGENRLHPDIKPWSKKLEDTTPDEIVEIVKNAGISGMGGATFPTYAKIQSALGKVEHIIINCAECEPFITANHRLLLENPDEVIGGLKILMHTFSLKEGIIAIEDNKRDAAKVLRERLGEDSKVKVCLLKTKYPQGDERQLIFALTGRKLAAGKLPADVGCCVFNAETCAAINRAFATGMPLTERIVTVDGDCIKNPKNLLVPLGTTYRDLITFCGGFSKTPNKIICGGPMMGVAQWDIDTAVTKGTSAVLALSRKFEHYFEQPSACIRCGRCVNNCPMRLMPSYLAMFSMQNKLDMAEEFSISSCIECGSCSYNCPGHVPIVQYIRATKVKINDRKRAMQAALEQSKLK
ncbi:MAG: electron transport complex subunit RsxC [Clostridia bacterium]|nr:electron transport complex subunit RsxC [Clostridia bacterium]